ncbi:MAG: hypothetical protein EXS11_05155 [Gemmataceae bacterium]|nr:hypothetical protein [Gemmataceae bacterium]
MQSLRVALKNSQKKKVDLGYRIDILSSPKRPSFAALRQLPGNITGIDTSRHPIDSQIDTQIDSQKTSFCPWLPTVKDRKRTTSYRRG